MTLSNLPPGLSDNEIIGNRPQDAFADHVIENLNDSVIERMDESPEIQRKVMDMAINMYWEETTAIEAAKLIEKNIEE